MTDPLFVVVAADAALADRLLGTVPPDCRATVLLLGDPDEGCEVLAADRVVALPDLAASPDAAATGPVIADELRAAGVVVTDGSQPSRDLAGWAAVALDLPLVWAVEALRVTAEGIAADRVVLGGTHRMVHAVAGPVFVLATPGVPASAQGRPGRGAVVEVRRTGAPASPVVPVDVGEAPAVNLAGARVVVTVGRGVGGAERIGLFAELADRLGAALGATRVVVDAGWLPFAHQVGQTGTTVAPELYLAFGVSGAIQHLAGMSSSRRIVAVNIDPTAALCRGADLVVEADAVAVAEALLKQLDDRAERRDEEKVLQ